MRTAASSLAMLRPRKLDEALRMMRDDGPLVPVAGATDLFVALNFGTLRATRFVDVWHLGSLSRIVLRDNVLSVGALATYTSVIRSRLVRRHIPMLADAAREVGGIQIQNRGTIGGNVANASPAGDTLPVLLAAGTVVVAKSVSEERRIPLAEFYTGYRTTVLRPDELITSLEIPRVHGRQWFRKVGTRAAQAISKVVMAGVRAPEPRIALGSVGPTVVRARAAETVLAGGGTIDDAMAALARDIEPIDDVRSSADYRRTVAANLLRQFWSNTAPPGRV